MLLIDTELISRVCTLTWLELYGEWAIYEICLKVCQEYKLVCTLIKCNRSKLYISITTLKYFHELPRGNLKHIQRWIHIHTYLHLILILLQHNLINSDVECAIVRTYCDSAACKIILYLTYISTTIIWYAIGSVTWINCCDHISTYL